MRIAYLGTGAIGVPALQSLHTAEELDLVCVVTQPDRPAGRGKRLLASPVKEWALQFGISMEQPESVNDPVVLKKLNLMDVDAAVVCAYGQILKPPVLNWPRFGCFNIHASLLPRHRGASCIQAALLSGDPETGISIIQMDPGLDTGPVLGGTAIKLEPDETADQLHEKLAQLAPGVLLKVLEEVKNGNSSPVPQDGEVATYAPKLSRADGQIDWVAPSVEVGRRIRAFHSWPGSFSFFSTPRGAVRRLKIFPPVTVQPAEGEPGDLVVRGDEVGVVCGDGGMIGLSRVQPESNRVMSARDWLRGFPGVTQLGSGADQ